MQLPATETLDHEKLTKNLWEVIHGLALVRAFLDETDHLSDRELYTLLWSDMLRGDEGGANGRKLSLPPESLGKL